MATSAPRYARAFAEVAAGAGLKPEAALQQMQDFSETLAGSAELREFLQNPAIEMPTKLKVLDAIAHRLNFFPQMRNFIAVVVEHQRMSEFDEIVAEYRQLADESEGAVEARVTSAHPLNSQERAQIEAQIGKLAGARVRASYAEDPKLLGGAVVEIGSTIYDGSVRTQLQQLRQRLASA